VELAEANSTLLQVGHVERFNPATTAAWPLIEAPKYIRAERFSPYAFRSTDISVVHDVMIHDLDLVLALVAAPVQRVEAFGVSLLGGHEDCVQARIGFANGCIADLTANRVSPVQRRHMQVWSASGCVDIDFALRQVAHYAPGDALKYGTSPLERARQPGADIERLKAEVFGTFIKLHKPDVAPRDALSEELLAFVNCVQSNQAPLVGGREALQAMLVSEEILASVAAHPWEGHAAGAVGPFPRFIERRKLAG
jgi:predicted dehydrogenase